ncbi:MAG: FAD-binding oxidoreductase [Actinomycetota bacterium]|nr:FAD-binding oxidoreductase [Actinomycetota bacterium]
MSLDGLIKQLGSDIVVTEGQTLIDIARDQWPRSSILARAGKSSLGARAVVRPRSTDEVAEILRWADETTTPVVPVGGGSGVCGAVAVDDAVVLDTVNLNGIVDFDEKSHLVTAESGVTGPQLSDFLTEREVMLGHEPQSISISTVGGWIATRASGQLSARYGGIEDLIAGFVAVLPGGRVARHKVAPRRTAGPDVSSLMIGSEGTLGVVTEATLRFFSLPSDREDRCVTFDHMADGVRACRLLAQSDLRPTLVRLYDADDTTLFMGSQADPVSGPLLLLSFDGPHSIQRADAAVDLAGGRRQDQRFVAHWWDHRNDAVDEFARIMKGEGLLGPHGVADTMEVAGSWSVLRDLYHSIKEALAEHADFVGCHLSHVYPDGGCLYFTMASATPDDDAALETNQKWWEVGMQSCLEVGGSISHHHGIGRLKAPWLDEELGGWRDVLVAVKRAVDPKGIMNPGGLGL